MTFGEILVAVANKSVRLAGTQDVSLRIMNNPVKTCPACQIGRLTGGLCPLCGYLEEAGAPEAPQYRSRKNRGVLWACFFASFLGSPVLALLTARSGGLSILGLGTIISGFILSRLFAKSETAFVALGIMFSLGIFAVYVGVAFVGCIALLNNLH